jgi:type IV secretory pathway VirB2 component (pilin)
MSDIHPTETDTSTERTTNATRASASDSRSLRWGASLIAVAGGGFVLNAVAMLYRVLYDPGFEAGVDTLGGATRAQLAASNPEVVHYIDHLHVNVAGLMAAAGIAMVALAWYGVRRGQRWSLATVVAVPVVFMAHSLPVHQTAGFSFDEVAHLAPGLLWLPALLVGAILAFHGLHTSKGPER